MNLGIMQPYFFPYIGYFQLMNAVDTFVVYDNIEYTKKGWINRNRFLLSGQDQLFSLPLKKDSDFLDIKQRVLADSFDAEKEKIKRQIRSAYQSAPNFDQAYQVFVECIDFNDKNLFNFILHSINRLASYLEIETELRISSQTESEQGLRGERRVLSICKTLRADHYINTIGGKELYDKRTFQENGIELSFIRNIAKPYTQFGDTFIPNLSIIDVMMFNSVETIRNMLDSYELE